MIRYTDSVQNVTSPMMEGFLECWKKPRTSAEHLEILKNSNHIVLAIDSDVGKVVGRTSVGRSMPGRPEPQIGVKSSHVSQGN